MSLLEQAKEKWPSALGTVTLGADDSAGGTRTSIVTVGGEKSLPFMKFEDGASAHRPAVAMEISDSEPTDWPEPLLAALGDVVHNPAEWAAACVEKYGAELICLKLAGTHPDSGNHTAEQAAKTVQSVLEAVGVPLIIWGSDHAEKDNEVMPVCSQAAAGERCLLGAVTEDNYKTMVASCMADGHCLIGLSPIDINIAKQVNVLVTDMGFPLDRLVMYQTTGALGYGLEYTYSIQERGRVAALSGDRLMAIPVICMVGQEAWRTKEARATAAEQPDWGDADKRGVLWELATAASLLQAGSDIVVMRHPDAAIGVKETIKKLVS